MTADEEKNITHGKKITIYEVQIAARGKAAREKSLYQTFLSLHKVCIHKTCPWILVACG